LSTVWQFWR